METLFTVRDVARVFGLKESRLRYWAQTGFINPRGRQGGQRVYTFGDLVEIKAAKDLLDAGIPLQRVRRNLRALRKALPEEPHPLARLRICSDGERLMVAEGDALVDPVSGQLMLDFVVDDLGQQVADVLDFDQRAKASRRAARSADGAINVADGELPAAAGDPQMRNAYGWFLHGAAIDDQPERLAEAIDAYQRAIALDPALAAAHTNLGNLYYSDAQPSAALRCYEAAIALDPDQPEARFNLANIYEDEGELELAIAEYRRALKLRPEFGDAHFNLALALEQVGGRQQAIEHWQRYLALVDEGAAGEWCDHARRHIAQLEQHPER